MQNQNIVIIGASGGIGSSFVKILSKEPSNTIHAFSRSEITTSAANVHLARFEYENEDSIAQAAVYASRDAPIDSVIITTGMLHGSDMMPEKSLSDLSSENFQRSFLANTIGPALIAKHFLPKLHRDQRTVFAALSARVGSISDNRLGGWYAYRASKAALNMFIKTASIELARKNKKAILVGLHPGTVATDLSLPFQQRVPSGKLFTAEFSAIQLLAVLAGLSAQDSGKVFAWDGAELGS